MIISQSKVKSYENTLCKRKWLAEATGEVETDTNEYMLRGAYFETLCLGSGVRGQVVNDLPRMKNGDKYVDHKRIDLQAQRFHHHFNPDSPDWLGWQITDRQLHLQLGEREGTLDFVCRRDGVRSIFDLKLNLNLGDPNGWWARPYEMDHLQLGFYRHLYRETYGEDPETYYALYDYSPEMRCKILKVNISEPTMAGYLLRFDSLERTLVESIIEKTPNFKECGKCKLECGERMMKPSVDFIEIDI